MEKAGVGLAALMVQGVATSIDALSVGFTIAEYEFPMALACALIIAADKDEAHAAAIVLEKNCQAAFLALKKGAKPVDRASAELEHAFYVKKYAKRKEEGHAEKTD